jgi:hypothetical protein
MSHVSNHRPAGVLPAVSRRVALVGLMWFVGACATAAPARPASPSATTSTPAPDVHGKLKNVDGLDVLWLWGTREQIGYAEGALLCGRIPRFFADYYLDFLVPLLRVGYEELSSKVLPRYQVPPADERLLRAVLQGMRDHCRPEDRLVRSARLEPAAGGQRELRYEDLVFANVAHEIFMGCSAFTVWGKASAAGATLHARNVDFLLDSGAAYTREQILKVYSEAEAGNARWAALSWPGSFTCHSCFTEDGLSMTVNGTNILPGAKTAAGKTPLASAQRAALLAATGPALRTESRVERMIADLQKSAIRTGANLNVFWPCRTPGCTGGVVLEHDGDASHPDGRVTVRRPNEADGPSNAIIATNHYLKRVSKLPDNPESIEHYRALRTGIDQSAKAGGVSVARARELMSAVAARAQALTVVTVILDTATQQLHVYRTAKPGQAATDSRPSVVSLAELFAAFPRSAQRR